GQNGTMARTAKYSLLLPAALFRNTGIANHEYQRNESAAFLLSSDPRRRCQSKKSRFQNRAREKHWFTFHAGRSPGGVEMNTTRRDFLKVGAGAVATTSAVSANSNQGFYSIASGRSAPAGGAGNMIYRRFGRTDVHISGIGMGGHHLGDVPTLDEADHIVHEAVDAGITFFDNAWEYYNGKTETILGRALRDGRREKVFLMTKVCTHGRSGKLAMQMLEDSLQRYQT